MASHHVAQRLQEIASTAEAAVSVAMWSGARCAPAPSLGDRECQRREERAADEAEVERDLHPGIVRMVDPHLRVARRQARQHLVANGLEPEPAQRCRLPERRGRLPDLQADQPGIGRQERDDTVGQQRRDVRRRPGRGDDAGNDDGDDDRRRPARYPAYAEHHSARGHGQHRGLRVAQHDQGHRACEERDASEHRPGREEGRPDEERRDGRESVDVVDAPVEAWAQDMLDTAFGEKVEDAERDRQGEPPDERLSMARGPDGDRSIGPHRRCGASQGQREERDGHGARDMRSATPDIVRPDQRGDAPGQQSREGADKQVRRTEPCPPRLDDGCRRGQQACKEEDHLEALRRRENHQRGQAQHQRPAEARRADHAAGAHADRRSDASDASIMSQSRFGDASRGVGRHVVESDAVVG